MPSIDLKTLNRLSPNDILLVSADQLIKAGKPVAENMIRRLARHKVAYLPVISFTYEEVEKLSLKYNKTQMLHVLSNEVENKPGHVIRLSARLLEKVKTIYVPYSENNSCFGIKGKKKQLTKNILLENNPGPLYQPDIDAGSESIIQPTNLRYIIEILKTIHSHLDSLNHLGPDTYEQGNRITRLKLNSIRMHSIYENERLSNVGNAFPAHAVDCAIYFLVAMMNLNKIRITQGCPLSIERFDPDKNTTKGEKYQYRPGMILDASLGIVLHAIGYSHSTIHALASRKPIVKDTDEETIKKRRTLQRNNFVIRNMLRNRKDISSIAKMISALQYEYPDGTGFPYLNENKSLHEFVRLFQVIDFYDEMTNPTISNYIFSRQDVINYMLDNSSNYTHVAGQFIKNKKFDRNMVHAFLQILAPYEIGEKVYLFPQDDRNTYYFVARVYSYLDSYIPLLSILHDRRSGKTYREGSLLFYIPQSAAFYMQDKKIVNKVKMDWIHKLEIFDYTLSPGNIREFRDDIFGHERKLARRFKKTTRNQITDEPDTAGKE